MNKKTIEHWPTVIVMDGRPYRLKELNRRGINNTCELCDLRTECGYPDGYHDFLELCTTDDRNDAWYFEEDWTIYDKRIGDFINIELADDFIDK